MGQTSGKGSSDPVALLTRKAEEYLRLSRVKCAGLSARTTETGRAAVCLDLAAACAQCPLDRVSVPGVSVTRRRFLVGLGPVQALVVQKFPGCCVVIALGEL